MLFEECVANLRKGMSEGFNNKALRNAANKTIDLYAAEEKSRFLSASAGDGTWPALAPSTIAKRSRKERPARAIKRYDTQAKKMRINLGLRIQLSLAKQFPILYDTGALYKSLTPGAGANVISYGNNYFSYGTCVYYAPFHQDPGVPGHPPRRTILVEPSKRVLDQSARLIAIAIDQIASGKA